MAQDQTLDLSTLDEPGSTSEEGVNWGEDGSIDISFDDEPQTTEAQTEVGNGNDDDTDINLDLGEEEESIALDSLAGPSEREAREAKNLLSEDQDIGIDPDDVKPISLDDHTFARDLAKEPPPQPSRADPKPADPKPAGPSLWQRLHQKWDAHLERIKTALMGKNRWLLWGVLALGGIGLGGFWVKEALTFSRLEVEQTFAVTSKKTRKSGKKAPENLQSGGIVSQTKRLLNTEGWTNIIPSWSKSRKWQPPSTTQANTDIVSLTAPIIKPLFASAQQFFSVQSFKKLGKGKKWQPPSTTQAKVKPDQITSTLQGLKARGQKALRKGMHTGSTKKWQPPPPKTIDLTKNPRLTRYPWWNTLTAWLEIHTQTLTQTAKQKLDALSKKGKKSLEGVGQKTLEKVTEKARKTYETAKKQDFGKEAQGSLKSLQKTVDPQALISQGKGVIGRVQSSLAGVPVLKDLPLERWSNRWLGKATKPPAENSVAAVAPPSLPPPPPVPVPKKPALPPPVRYKNLKPQQPQAWVVRSAAQQSVWQPNPWHAIAQANRERYQDAVFFAANATWRLPLPPNSRGLSIPEKAGKPRFYYPSQGYVVQVSTFPHHQIRFATTLTNRLIQQGRFAHLVRTRNNNQTTLEVRVGPFSTREEAIRQTYPIALQHAIAKNAWVQRTGKISQQQLLHGVTRSYPWAINVLRSENFNTASKAAKQINPKGKLVYITQHRSVYGKFFYSVRIGYFASPHAAQRRIRSLASQWPTVQPVEITQLEENLPGQPTNTVK